MDLRASKDVERVCKIFHIDQCDWEKQIISKNMEIQGEIRRRRKDLMTAGKGFRSEVQGTLRQRTLWEQVFTKGS